MENLLNALIVYPTKGEAFEHGSGDNFFEIDNFWICVSENYSIYSELIEAGYKTDLQMFLETNK